MKRWLILLLISGCCPTPADEHIPVKQWTRDEQRQILAEEQKLPPDSILISLIEDYAKLRREAR
jgi:hypothetical protein